MSELDDSILSEEVVPLSQLVKNWGETKMEGEMVINTEIDTEIQEERKTEQDKIPDEMGMMDMIRSLFEEQGKKLESKFEKLEEKFEDQGEKIEQQGKEIRNEIKEGQKELKNQLQAQFEKLETRLEDRIRRAEERNILFEGQISERLMEQETKNENCEKEIFERVENKLQKHTKEYQGDLQVLKIDITKKIEDNEEKQKYEMGRLYQCIEEQKGERLEARQVRSREEVINAEEYLIEFRGEGDWKTHPMYFLKFATQFCEVSGHTWESDKLSLLKFLVGSANRWAREVIIDLQSVEEFKEAFKRKYWNRKTQRKYENEILGNGSYKEDKMDLVAYVMRHYDNNQYLDQPMELKEFMKEIAKHVPKEMGVVLATTSEVMCRDTLRDFLQKITVITTEKGDRTYPREEGRFNRPSQYQQNNNYRRYQQPNSHGTNENNGRYQQYNRNESRENNYRNTQVRHENSTEDRDRTTQNSRI